MEFENYQQDNERLRRIIKLHSIPLKDYEKKNIAHVWHAYLKRYFGFVGAIVKGISWFVSDLKFKYKMAFYKNEQCSKCFGKLYAGLKENETYGGFDYKGKTFYVCRDCYESLHNKK